MTNKGGVNKQGDLSVITKAKEVCSYILTITDKSPKRFRFTLVSRLQNYSLTIIEKLIMANEIYVCNNRREVDENALLANPGNYVNNNVNNENAIQPAWS